MRDISTRELKGHNILAVERFQDNTRRMIEFSVLRSCAYGSPSDEMRLFLTEDGYQTALQSQQRREIKIKRYARVIEGHILDNPLLSDTEIWRTFHRTHPRWQAPPDARSTSLQGSRLPKDSRRYVWSRPTRRRWTGRRRAFPRSLIYGVSYSFFSFSA